MSKNKVLLFYNPYAGNGLFKNNLDRIIESFQKKNMLVIPVRAGDENIVDKLFKEIDNYNFSKIIAAGGDGTINSIVNGMMRNDIHIPLAVFPAGTANDFAYYMDLPQQLDEGIDIALSDKYTYADVGKVNDKYFINVLSSGMLVDISQKTPPGAKSTLGVISYYIRGISELPNLKPIPVKITCAECKIETNMYFILVMNGKSAGGFKRIAPNAKINDGLLDVMLFKEMPIVELAPLLVNVMAGQHQDNKNVIHFKTSKMRVESSKDISADIDGEQGGKMPLDIEIIPNRLRINTLKDNVEGARW